MTERGRGETALAEAPSAQLPTRFRPQEAKATQAKLDALIDYATKVKDFTLIERAVEEKVTQQEEFVGWWRGNVTKGHGGDRSKIAERKSWLPADDAERVTGIGPAQVSRWAKRLQKRDDYVASLVTTAYKKAMGQEALGESRAGKLLGVPEWYTPPEYIEAARRVLGSIDLDPASNAYAQQVVKAATYYTAKDDGLAQEWRGRVFLNPPYNYPLVEQFVEKLLTSDLEAAILLTNNATDTAWWHSAASACRSICFTRGRISFYQKNGTKNAPTHGQTFFYFGDDLDSFAGEFSAFGLVR